MIKCDGSLEHIFWLQVGSEKMTNIRSRLGLIGLIKPVELFGNRGQKKR